MVVRRRVFERALRWLGACSAQTGGQFLERQSDGVHSFLVEGRCFHLGIPLQAQDPLQVRVSFRGRHQPSSQAVTIAQVSECRLDLRVAAKARRKVYRRTASRIPIRSFPEPPADLGQKAPKLGDRERWHQGRAVLAPHGPVHFDDRSIRSPAVSTIPGSQFRHVSTRFRAERLTTVVWRERASTVPHPGKEDGRARHLDGYSLAEDDFCSLVRLLRSARGSST
jgi:hypothetical protein